MMVPDIVKHADGDQLNGRAPLDPVGELEQGALQMIPPIGGGVLSAALVHGPNVARVASQHE
jgi:hypothetical protein